MLVVSRKDHHDAEEGQRPLLAQVGRVGMKTALGLTKATSPAKTRKNHKLWLSIGGPREVSWSWAV